MYYTKEELQETIENKIEEAQTRFGKQFKFALLEILSLEKMLNPIESQEKKSRLIELSKWNKYHEYPSVGALRQYVHKQNKNGFDKVIEYGGENGGRILIDEDKFFAWQASRRKANL